MRAVGPVRGWMSWSSGKDSAFALHSVRTGGRVEITGLLTTLTQATDRVAAHGVRRVLLQAQADALGLGLHVVQLPRSCPNDVYEQRMTEAMAAARQAGAEQLVFGDLFLDDVRAYREQALQGTGMTPSFPLWGRPTAELAGRWYDEQLLRELPTGVDPCGERGEFHTFVVDGPGFATGLHVAVGDITERDGFVFADLLPT